MSKARRVLFVCEGNLHRSPTAERLYASTPAVQARSAGLSPLARVQVTDELLAWADVVFVMERRLRKQLRRLFPELLHGKELVCLDVPDEFQFQQPELVAILTERLAVHLGRPGVGGGSAEALQVAPSRRDMETCMGEIRYIKGDATCPQAKGVKLICHICNDVGGWGKGFVLALSRRWAQPEAEYRAWHASGKQGGFGLGGVQFVQVEPYVWVANMVAQRGTKRGSSGPPIRYDAVAACLQQVAAKALELKASVHMPRIGCGLAGGEWSKVEPLLEEHLCRAGVAVTVYDFE